MQLREGCQPPRRRGRREGGREKGASRLDKPVFSSSPKCHVPGENRPLARAFPLVKLPKSGSEEGPSPLLSANQATSIPETHAQPPLQVRLSLPPLIQADASRSR
jgi:hypothetical protein